MIESTSSFSISREADDSSDLYLSKYGLEGLLGREGLLGSEGLLGREGLLGGTSTDFAVGELDLDLDLDLESFEVLLGGLRSKVANAVTLPLRAASILFWAYLALIASNQG